MTLSTTSSPVTTAQCPAKINLFLHVVGRRPDGYHLLQSIFCPITWFDELSISSLSEPNRIEVVCNLDLPTEQNLVWRAAQLLQQQIHQRHPQRECSGVHLHVKKNIPTGAGLGGGSSNAATTLKLLRDRWAPELTNEDLAPLALELGADVPFFLQNGPAWVEGIGENCQAVRLETRWLVLIKPAFSIPTASIFRDPSLTLAAPEPRPQAEEDLWHYAHQRNNHLQRIAEHQHPALKQMLTTLHQITCQYPPLFIRMTGSGSAVFAVFKHENHARAFEHQCRQHALTAPESPFRDGQLLTANTISEPSFF